MPPTEPITPPSQPPADADLERERDSADAEADEPEADEPEEAPFYSERNERLQALVQFVSVFGPLATAGYEGGVSDPLRGDHQDDEMVSARNLALTAAYQVIHFAAKTF